MSNCNHLVAHWEGCDEGGVLEGEDILDLTDTPRLIEEWFKYCPRCGMKLPKRNKKGEVIE